MEDQDEGSRDRIDPVTGIVTGETSEDGLDREDSPEQRDTGASGPFTVISNSLSLIGALTGLILLPIALSELAPNNSLFSEIIPTMIQAWVALAIFIVLGGSFRIFGGRLYRIFEPIIVPGKGQKREKKAVSISERVSNWYSSFKSKWLAAPNNISMAVSSAWRGRERGLAIFAGVFLSSLVITTVLAYAVGLNQAFFAFSLEGDEFDAKVDFQSDPDGSWAGRTNDSAAWSPSAMS